jgi:hypothetical protein
VATTAPAASAGPEVADVLRDHAQALRLSSQQARAVRDIVACRTSRLGGHLEVCPSCGFSRGTYNSCRNRHCPKCQRLKQELWAEAQEAILLPVHHFQVVFTVPGELRSLFRLAMRVCLDLLFEAVSETLLEVARSKLKAQIGLTAVLHTWNQLLGFHPHVHCVVPGGGLSPDGTKWIGTSPRFFLAIGALTQTYRGKLLSKLEKAIRDGDVPGDEQKNLARLKAASRKAWSIDVRAPLGGPRHVIGYLSRYVHRIAIASSRLVAYDGKDVTFRYKDRADDNKAKLTTVSGPVFARRFLQHVLPARFVRIRHYGLLATRNRQKLRRCRELLGAKPMAPREKDASWADAFQRLFGTDPLCCPACRLGRLVVRAVIPPMRM